jgi:predicted Zn-ribbon and HTH transcriptional regulator
MRPRLTHHLPTRRAVRRRTRSRAEPLITEPLVVPNAAVVRVRRAGGPIDEASYTCDCGYVFQAPVSTTVACPHCEAQQPW